MLKKYDFCLKLIKLKKILFNDELTLLQKSMKFQSINSVHWHLNI